MKEKEKPIPQSPRSSEARLRVFMFAPRKPGEQGKIFILGSIPEEVLKVQKGIGNLIHEGRKIEHTFHRKNFPTPIGKLAHSA